MERVLKPYDKEYMRLAMLKHEETFKEQVFELHRLYRIQKLLMRNIGKTNCKNRPSNYHNHHQVHNHQELWNSSRNGFSFNPKISNTTHNNNNNNTNNTSPPDRKFAMKLDLERPAEEFAESNGEEDERNGSVLNESEIELTLGPTSYFRTKKQPETTLTSESAGASLSSSSTGSSHINRRNNKAREGFGGLVQAPALPETGINRLKHGSSSSNVVNEQQQQQQDRLKQQQPPWLFQVLSLNMT